MASLIKDAEGRSPYWICCYTTADGRRLKKSTKQKERSKAMEVCLAVQRAETLAGSNNLTEVRARELIGEILERTSGESILVYTVEAWLKEWLRGKEVSKSSNTHIKYAHTVESFLTHLGNRAKLNIAAISSKDIAGFRDAQIASGKHPNTVYYLVKQIRIPFNAAKRQGLIAHNPAEAVELPGKLKGEDGGESVKEAFTPNQIAALLKAAVAKTKNGLPIFDAGQDWQGAILLAYYTGARLQDVANMTWGSIDFPSKTISYRAMKTKRKLTVPLHPQLEAYLLELPTSDGNKVFLFPKLAGKTTGGRSGLSMTFSKMMAHAKIKGEILRKGDKAGLGRTVRSLTFHSLRHSFNSAMANAGVAQEVRMKLTGHSSSEMNKNYTHLELEPLRQAVTSIPSLEKGS